MVLRIVLDHDRISLSEDNKTSITVDIMGCFHFEWHPTNRMLHREEGPAYIFWDPARHNLSHYWYYHGMLHRIGGPAVLSYKGDCLSEVSYYYRGRLHRHDGPAIIRYLSTGEPLGAQWWCFGELHRMDGPASITYNGRRTRFSWYLRGDHIRDKYVFDYAPELLEVNHG